MLNETNKKIFLVFLILITYLHSSKNEASIARTESNSNSTLSEIMNKITERSSTGSYNSLALFLLYGSNGSQTPDRLNSPASASLIKRSKSCPEFYRRQATK